MPRPSALAPQQPATRNHQTAPAHLSSGPLLTSQTGRTGAILQLAEYLAAE